MRLAINYAPTLSTPHPTAASDPPVGTMLIVCTFLTRQMRRMVASMQRTLLILNTKVLEDQRFEISVIIFSRPAPTFLRPKSLLRQKRPVQMLALSIC